MLPVQHFDGHGLLEGYLARAVDRPHGPRPEKLLNDELAGDGAPDQALVARVAHSTSSVLGGLDDAGVFWLQHEACIHPPPMRANAGPRKAARPGRRPHPRLWSARVSSTSNALDLEAGVFNKPDPRAIAESLLRSARQSRRRKSSPLRSAMSMLTFYINRAGRQLPARQRRILEEAKEELRAICRRTA